MKRGRDQGVESARLAGAGIHADVIETFKGQLLIVLLKRLGASAEKPLSIPLAEIDDTGSELLAFAIRDGAFVFSIERKS